MMNRNILACILLLICVPFLGKSQNAYAKEWKIIDSLLGKANQPKTALARVNRLYQEVHSKGIVDQSIKSLAYKFILEKRVSDKDESENTILIDEALKNPINPLERSLLWFMKAGTYINYYNRFQYNLQSRNDTLAYKDSDWATWTLKDFQWKIYHSYQNALKDSLALQNATIKAYPTIVQFGNVSDLRPTLYDLVVNSAIDFYKNVNKYTWENGKNVFELKDATVLGEMPTFLQYRAQTNDSVSIAKNIIDLYQRLLRFHLQDEKKDVLIDVDNQRVEWFYKSLSNTTANNIDSSYLNSLRFLVKQYPENPQTLQSVYMIANYYNGLADKYNRNNSDSTNKYKRITALNYINQYLSKDTIECKGWYNLAILKAKITESKVENLTLESINVPNEPLLGLLRFQNLEKVTAKVVALPKYTDNNSVLGDSIIRSFKILKQYSIDLLKNNDYQPVTTEIKIEPLPVGNYMLCLSTDEKGEKSRLYAYFQVSELAYFNTNGDYFVVNRKTGRPIEGVKFSLDKKIATDPIDFAKSQLTSDKDGHIILRALTKNIRNPSGYFYKGNDTLFLNDYSMIPYITTSQEVKKVLDKDELEEEREDNMKMLYFTDRNIYRPGQQIHFKSVVYTQDDRDSNFHIFNRKDSIRFLLTDVNNKIVDSLFLKTDDFGSVSGTFKIPNNVLTGSFTIGNDGNGDNLEVQVEEYKRPTFFVEMDTVKGTYHLNHPVTIAGTAKAYNGSKVSNASVKLHIERSARFPYYWMRRNYYSSNKEILDTTILTDAQGKFHFDFTAIPDESVDSASLPIFQYAINVEVTDKNGETRSKESSVAVGYNSVDVQWSIGENAKLLSFKDLSVSVKNTNGISVAIPVEVKVQPIEKPAFLLRQKYWSQPDIQVMDSLTYKKYFPNDVYRNENKMEFWKKENALFEKTVQPDSLFSFKEKLNPGWYYLEANIVSPEGKKLKDYRYVQLLPDGTPLTDNYLEGFGNNFSADLGDTVKQYLSTASDEMYLTQIAQNNEKTLFKNLKLIKGTLPIIIVLKNEKEQYWQNAFAGYKDNRFYQATFSINTKVKTESLSVHFKTFRDKVEPSSKEKWSVRVLKDSSIANNTQLLSAMYDASLDQILKGDWRYAINNPYTFRRAPSFSNPYSRTTYGIGIGSQYFRNPFAIHYPQLTFENGNINPEGELNEVVVNAFGAVRKQSFSTGAVATISANPAEGNGRALDLMGKMPGISVSDDGNLRLRGSSSLGANANPMYVIDGQIVIDGSLSIAPSDIESMNVLKGADATSIYGSAAANGVIIITTKSKAYGKKINPPPLRSNFSETAFFYPSLTADKDGNYWIEFTMPDAVTQWRWRNLAMDKDLHFGYSEMMITSQKTLMIQPNMPRFLRAGDELVLTAKVSNTSMKPLNGKAFVQLLDRDSNLLHWQKVDQTDFQVAADQSSTVAFHLKIPESYSGPLFVKMWAEGGQFSDGELHEIPVLSRQILVTETLPFELKGDTVAHLDFSKLLASDSSKTLQNKNLSIELSSNPVWYAVQAIPYLQSYPYECSEQVFSRMCGGFLANRIMQLFPQIQSVMKKWENDPEALKSNLQKNSELKQVLLEETPWINNAETEAEQKRKLALYFNTDSVDHLLQKNFDLLSKRQLSDGSFSWYEGEWGDRYITQNIVTQYMRLQSLQAVEKKWQVKFAPIIQKAQKYLASKIEEDYKNLKKWKTDLKINHTGSSQLMYLYSLSLDSTKHTYSVAEKYYLQQSKKYWNDFSNIQKAWLADIFYRKGEKSFAINTVIRSLMENAVESKISGTYWKPSFDWGFGYMSNIETHSQIMTTVNMIADKEGNSSLKRKVEEMQHWLIRNKQTNYWSNTKSTSEACYAILTVNKKWINTAPKVEIKMGDTMLHIAQQEAGTGYTKITIPTKSIQPSLGKITVDVSANPGYIYGGVYWQYLENMDKITTAKSPLNLTKTFYKEVTTNGEKHLQEVKSGDVLQVGDKLIVRVAIKADRDMQYVHLKDLRPSNTEPDDAISGYQYKGNLGYYLSIKDVSSNFFFNTISKGTHLLEYSVHVTHAGNFATGIASLQCMYAPEMNSHSEGSVLEVQ